MFFQPRFCFLRTHTRDILFGIFRIYTAVFGEVGLTGEIRPVPRADKRVYECIKTGFKKVVLPAKNLKACEKYADKIELVPVKYVGQMLKALGLREKKES